MEVRKLDVGSSTYRRIYNLQNSPFCDAEFLTYLKVNKKRNIRQIMCYAQRYHSILLQTQDASPIVNLQSGAMRRHAMESLTLLAKYRGLSDSWADIRKRYSLKWTGGENGSIQSLQRFFDESKTMDKMIQWVREVISALPVHMASIIKFNCL